MPRPSTAVWNCLERAQRAGISWPLPPDLDEACLDRQLCAKDVLEKTWFPPDLAAVHQELRRKGVTLQLLWQEYREAHPKDGYTFAEVTETQTLKDWSQSHVHAFEFFDGVAEVTVPDQTKTAVVRSCRYELGSTSTTTSRSSATATACPTNWSGSNSMSA